MYFFGIYRVHVDYTLFKLIYVITLAYLLQRCMLTTPYSNAQIRTYMGYGKARPYPSLSPYCFLQNGQTHGKTIAGQ